MPARVRILDALRQGTAERDRLAALVHAHFGVVAAAETDGLDLEGAYDGSRRQYDASALLAQVAAAADAGGGKCLAVVGVDLFVPVLSFVFGQAMLAGRAGIVSAHRLHNEFYGLARDERRLRERLDKEIVHELGHMFGLYHCRQFECVMRSSTYVEEIDLKRIGMCPACAEKLRELAAGKERTP